MRNRYRLIRKRGVFYFHAMVTGVRESDELPVMKPFSPTEGSRPQW